jgi:hypothetical protein
MTDPTFENNFDDLLHKPPTNTLSDSLSSVDVSNPFSDAISPQNILESISESENEVGNNAVFKPTAPIHTDPLEHSFGSSNGTSTVFRPHVTYETLGDLEDKTEFEDVDVSSVKGIAAISPPYSGYVHNSYNGDYAYEEHVAPYRVQTRQQLLTREDNNLVQQITESIDESQVTHANPIIIT